MVRKQMNRLEEYRKMQLKDASFGRLMQERVYNILLIATKYDMFMLEADGRIEELIFNEYTSLNLRYPPRFHQVTTEAEALSRLSEHRYDMIIFMPNMVDSDVFCVPKEVKKRFPSIPIVVLTPFSKEVSKCIEHEDLSAIDYVFSWLGEAELLLAIIKLMEDAKNAPADTRNVGVQVILLVEDSIRFYSAALPSLYKIVLEQSREFAKEALNEHQKMLRMRGRPKILLARSFEEATHLYEEYKGNILGVVSDFSFMREGIKDPLAGLKFCRTVRDAAPVIMESSESANERYAKEIGAAFINKNSKTYAQDLRQNVMERFGFGDFVIRLPQTGEEALRIKDLKDLQHKIFDIPDDALREHLRQNHFSRFLYSRALFAPAEILRAVDVSVYVDMQQAKQFIYDTIVQYRRMKNVGIVAVFEKERFDEYSNFARIGEGSLGGKGRGLAFIGAMLKRNATISAEKFPVNIPKTVVLCTDVFDKFMEMNQLYDVAMSDMSDADILHHFVAAQLPEEIYGDLSAFIGVIRNPIAVRSSSLLEDAHYQPFAGVYSTYMVPFTPDENTMLAAVADAVKGVYASVYFKDSKAYMTATSNLIESEKMAIVLQEIAGRQYGQRYYPTISGVAKSLNFYPIGDEKTEEGVVNMALGLGKYVVDGGVTLRFSPSHPHAIMQLSTPEYALRDTQTQFLALDTGGNRFKVPGSNGGQEGISTDDGYNLVRLSLREAEKDGVLKYIASTYDVGDNIVREGYYPEGRKIITFSSILRHNALPLCATLKELLHLGCKEMGRPVEIEFAVDIASRNEGSFYILQIRPIVDRKETIEEDLSAIDPAMTLLCSHRSLGHGNITDVSHILYVRTRDYNSANNKALAAEIEAINRRFTASGQGYVLAGPGRWGSNDEWLGVPVRWSAISNARIIAEVNIENYNVEPSQGTHFFQNVTSNGVGYFTVYSSNNDNFDEALLESLPAEYETRYLRLVRFDKPLEIKMDGKKGVGIVRRG